MLAELVALTLGGSSLSPSIFGGTPAPSASFGVGICRGERQESCDFRCSGALIAPNLVVTVRHCVEPVSTSEVVCGLGEYFKPTQVPASYFWITTGATGADRTTATWHRGAEWIYPKSRSICGGDLAFLILDENIPAREAVPAEPLVLEPPQAYGPRFSIVGHGADVPNGIVGTRRQASGVALVCAPAEKNYGCTSDLGFVASTEFVLASGACVGDSGSGAYAQTEMDSGRPRVVGVLTREARVFGEGTCGRGLYTRLDAWTDTLREAALRAASRGNYSPPAWVQSLPEPRRPKAPYAPRTLGADCADSSDCDSNVCATNDGAITWSCSVPCSAGCPAGFGCGAGGNCFPEAEDDSGGACTTSSPRSTDDGRQSPWALVTLGVVACVAVFRRRRSSFADGEQSKS